MATTNDKAVFIDTNVLVYANVVESPLHDMARERLEGLYQQGVDLWISRQVIREFLATRTRPRLFSKPIAFSQIIERIHHFEDHFIVADESAAVTAALLDLVKTVSVAGKRIHDANIVATMLTYGVPALLTHNVKDFKHFSGYIRIISLEQACSAMS